MKKICFCLALSIFALQSFAFGQNETGAIVQRSLGNGSRYAFQDSQGREWFYTANSSGGYDVYDDQQNQTATVTATFE